MATGFYVPAYIFDLFWNHFCVSVNILCWKLGAAEQQTVQSKQS